ncbi:MAG TPA: sigma-70 family RNA polymerase sigma factor [Nannocystaceae bacterium]|nr:sigma-70 family RNA polymerase sigma factor [Nannocystaceae bacterium]
MTHRPPQLVAVAHDDDPSSPDAAIGRALQGDVGAWSQIYAAYYGRVFRQLRYLCGDRHTAEELTQDTFAQAMASRARFDPSRPFLAWLRGIALNVAHNRWRKEQGGARAHRKLALIADAQPRRDDPAERQLELARSQALYAALAELPERWREAFVLKELHELSAAEVGELVGATEGNVAVRVTRARQRLREILGDHGWLEQQVPS